MLFKRKRDAVWYPSFLVSKKNMGRIRYIIFTIVKHNVIVYDNYNN